MTPTPAIAAPAPCPQPTALPTPHQLARLGTVLCLYRQQPRGELAGWSQAVRVEAGVELDSDGACEHLLFYDAGDRCCWRLYLLPDSDFLAWERLSARLPAHAAPSTSNGLAERLLRRLSGPLGGRWAGSVLRLHALRGDAGEVPAPHAVLAASLAPVSQLGAVVAHRIAQRQGADARDLADACCCERAARAAARVSAHRDAYAPVHLDSRPHSTGKQA
ncbi:Hemin transport protein [Luteimonas saliphila]|uniref:Hemin transport protein n=1 Tax=Luteimonas saliphila TaxID=2804919 RepID=UPI00192D2482|nr:Hemin transport protein [Luteimonas saliphila]